MEYKIGSLKLKNPYFLAPMAGVNDIAFRILCKKAGAGLVYTGMINPLTREKLNLSDKPAIQLFSKNEKGISEFIKKHESKASLFDFNLGCPAKKAEKQGYGSFMHSNAKTIQNILSIMKDSTKKPITLKLRISHDALKLLKLAEKYCDAICIHPRTNSQGYSGKADISFAEKLKQKTSLPVIYSGDVNESNADSLLKKFNFVMIARNAIGNPNIFAKLTGNKERFGFSAYLNLALKHKLYFSQIKSQAIFFTKNQRHAGKIRAELARAKSVGEIREIIERKS